MSPFQARPRAERDGMVKLLHRPIPLVVLRWRGAVAGHSCVQSTHAHQEGRWTRQSDSRRRPCQVQQFWSRHFGHILPDQDVLGAARVARCRRVLYLRCKDYWCELEVLSGLFLVIGEAMGLVLVGNLKWTFCCFLLFVWEEDYYLYFSVICCGIILESAMLPSLTKFGFKNWA